MGEFDNLWNDVEPLNVPTVTPVTKASEFDGLWNANATLVPYPTTAPSVAEQEEDDWWNSFTSWTKRQGDVTRTIGRVPVRAGEDLYNAANEVFNFSTRARWEDKLFEKPESAAEDITAEIGTWLGTFWIPGGIAAKAATKAGSATKITSKLDDLVGLIAKGSKGKKAVKVGKIMGEGAFRGAIADYITTDVGDLEGEAAIQKRLGETVEGAAIGAGVNLTMFGIGRTAGVAWKKYRALKKVKQAAEGKGDPIAALQGLKKAVEEENAVKDDILAELTPKDPTISEKPLDLDNLKNDGIAPEPAKADVDVPSDTPKKKKLAKKEPRKPVEEPRDPELDIEEYIQRAQSLPEQINKLVRLNVAIAEDFNPKIDNLIKTLQAGKVGEVKAIVETMETSLRRYRKMMELRAKSGNITGKSLVAFKGKVMDFRKPMTYKPEVLRRMNQVDNLLQLVRDVKAGKAVDDKVAASLRDELQELETIATGGSLADVIDASFKKTRDNAVDTVWGKYKEAISQGVLRTLKTSSPQAKAALETFSNRVTQTLSDAVKNNKTITKRVASTLDNVQDILANPEKYKEALNKILADISKAKNIKAADKERAITVLRDLIDGREGQRLFDILPNRGALVQKILKEELKEIGTSLKKAVSEGTEKELVKDVMDRIAKRSDLGVQEKEALLDHVRAELGNALSDIKNDIFRKFMSKELYQKFTLRDKVRELDDMSDKSIEDIRKYLAENAPTTKQTPADIKALQDQVKASKKVLTDRVKQADTEAANELTKKFLRELSGLQEYDLASVSNFELFLRTLEKLRMNTMLFSPRTWLVGVPSAAFNLAYQPVHQAVKQYVKLSKDPFNPLDHGLALKAALQNLKATSEYFSNWGDIARHVKATFQNNGKSSFNPKSFRRHEEDLVEAGGKQIEGEPLKITFKDRQALAELLRKYGVDSEANQGRFRKFFMDVVDGEPTTPIGRLLDPLFSISFRAMGVMDEPFKVMGTLRALRSDALQQGVLKELEGKALDEFVEKRMKSALKDNEGLAQWARNEEFDEVEQLGLSIVYQADYADKALSNMAQRFSNYTRGEDAYSDPIKILLRLSVPFIKTPTAIAQWTVDHFPVLSQAHHIRVLLKRTQTHGKIRELEKLRETNTLALTTKSISKEQADKAQQALTDINTQLDELNLKAAEELGETTANSLLGTTMMIGLTSFAASGIITGSGAHLAPDQRRRLTDAGWRPNTIKIGDKRVSYLRLEPWSTFLSVSADLVHYQGMTGGRFESLSRADQDMINMLHTTLVTNLSDKYFVRGLNDLLSVMSNPNKDVSSIPVDFAASLSPTILRDFGTFNEEFQREAIGWQRQLQSRAYGAYPGQYRRNMLGEKVDRVWGMDGWWGVISPITWSDAKSDPLMKELAGLRGTLGQSRVYSREGIDSRNFYHTKTGQSLYDAWMAHMSKFRDADTGRTLRTSLKRLMRSDEYKDAPMVKIDDDTETKSELVSTKIAEYRTQAWKDMKKRSKFKKSFKNSEDRVWTESVYTDDVNKGVLPLLTDPALSGF